MKNVPINLLPNIDNVSREFIMDTMINIMFDKSYPNFYFDFKQEEALIFIKNTLIHNNNLNNIYIKLIDELKNKNFDGIKPVMIINDYKKFFTLLIKLYEKVIDLYFLDFNNIKTDFPKYELRNYFNNIWLRMIPEDFNNPLLFLEKQIKMIDDKTLDKYNRETILGELNSFDKNIITIKNDIADNWDENSKEFSVRMYDKKYFNNDLYIKPHIKLPLIRYGIYEKDGKKVCSIGSIQNKNLYTDEDIIRDLNKLINRKKYKLNNNIDKEYIKDIEPKNLFVLSIFVNILIKEGIYNIEIPTGYVLDYDYHKKRSKVILNEFLDRWNSKRINDNPCYYKEDLDYLKLIYKKEDLISEIKNNRMIKLFERLLIHYKDFSINSYPNELDNIFHINLNDININNINNDVLKEISYLVDNNYKNKIFKKCI